MERVSFKNFYPMSMLGISDLEQNNYMDSKGGISDIDDFDASAKVIFMCQFYLCMFTLAGCCIT